MATARSPPAARAAVARSSGNSASVRRTGASKLSAMWRWTFGPARVGEAPAPRGARVVDQQVQLAVLALHRLTHAGGRAGLGQVDGDDRRAAQLVGQGAQAILATGDQHEPHV